MSPFVINLLLISGGAVAGAFINWAIYNLCYEDRGPISPWSLPEGKASARKPLDFVPVLGWISLRRDDSYHGQHHWVRPMLIEATMIAAAFWFYHWQIGGGLVGGKVPCPDSTKLVWFSGHSLLIILMMIATFIDFDEKTIPDWITVPGTIAALLFAAFYTDFRLPEVVNNPAGMGVVYQPVHFNSPDVLPTWQNDWRGLLFSVFVLGGWAFALLPTTPFLFRFMWKAFKRHGLRFPFLVLAFMLQSKRKTKCSIRIKNRKSLLPNILTMGFIFAGLLVLTAYMFYQPFPGLWNSYFGAIFGLAFGGGLVWAVRIIGGYAMGQEAMGFGDVTLMAMIGAFLGWQSALLTFVFAPFAAMLIALAQVILTKKNDIAFGPYLCLAALILLIGWSWFWNEWARNSIFVIGSTLFYIILGGLVALGVMLAVIQWFKGIFAGPEVVE